MEVAWGRHLQTTILGNRCNHLEVMRLRFHYILLNKVPLVEAVHKEIGRLLEHLFSISIETHKITDIPL